MLTQFCVGMKTRDRNMSLIDLLRSLVGADKEEAIEDVGFACTPDSEGLNLFVDTATFSALGRGDGSTLQKMQLIVLRMLQEQGIALPIANGFRVPSEDVAGLDDDQAQVLRLPSRYCGTYVANISGRTGSSGFRVDLSARDGNATVPFVRKGPLLYLTRSEIYRLTPAELLGIQAWEAHSELEAGERGEAANLRLMAELQTAERSGMRVDLGHFDRLDVVVPENVGVSATRMPDGSLMLCPTLGDGSTPDQLEKRWSQLDLGADGGVLRIDNRVVLLEPRKLAAVREVLGNKRIPADKIPEFLATPSAFLDAALVNLELGFSIRVLGIGRLQHMQFGELDSHKQDWFGLDSRPLPPEILQSLIKTPEELARFEQIYIAAVGQGASSASFAGEMIDMSRSERVEKQLAQIRQNFAKPDRDYLVDAPRPVDEPKETVTVQLQDAEYVVGDLLERASKARSLSSPDWSAYARQPFPHQREGVEWLLGMIDAALTEDRQNLYRLQGALLADDMGLGKTYMTLVAVGELIARQRAAARPEKPVLVVAPLSLLENWEDEVASTFRGVPFRDIVVLQSGRDLNRFRVRGAERESAQQASLIDESGRIDTDAVRYALNVGPEAGAHRLDMDRRLVLTTYQTLRDYQFSLCRIDWGLVIFDEAQNIKNPNALQTHAAKGLKADFKLLATGTPVENSLADFWCLMDTAQPGLLGNWSAFRDRWIKPILSASESQRHEVRRDVGTKLRAAVGAFMLRRVKEDQLTGLPTKTIYAGVQQTQTERIVHAPQLSAPMSGEQLRAYDDVLDEYRSQRAKEGMRGNALAVLQRLREISLHPNLRQEDEIAASNAAEARQRMASSAKLVVLLNLLDRLRAKNEKVILFMVTKRLQRCLKLWLDLIYTLDIAIINGDTTAVAKRSDVLTRKQLISAFEAQPGFNVLIMSPVAAGVGLTVVGANHVVHLERHWNPAKEAQASDRVYRIGQKRDVHIYLPAVVHPLYDSFDVHLDRLLRGKLMLKDAVVTPDSVRESEMIQSMGL